MSDQRSLVEEVLRFWFVDTGPSKWFVKDPEFDEELRRRFGDFADAALNGELEHWKDEPKGDLALILVLDQFRRNIFRDTPSAFVGDPIALSLSQEAAKRGELDQCSLDECSFYLMPMMHSEAPEVHAEAEALFQRYTRDGTQDYARKHRKIIDRFGRYPHRNAILGRESTAEELEFLGQPGSSF